MPKTLKRRRENLRGVSLDQGRQGTGIRTLRLLPPWGRDKVGEGQREPEQQSKNQVREERPKILFKKGKT